MIKKIVPLATCSWLWGWHAWIVYTPNVKCYKTATMRGLPKHNKNGDVCCGSTLQVRKWKGQCISWHVDWDGLEGWKWRRVGGREGHTEREERDRGRDIEKDRDKPWERDRQTEWQRDSEREGGVDRDKERGRNTYKDWDRERETHRQTRGWEGWRPWA